MKAPPSYPFWPLSVAGPKRIDGLTFKTSELKSLSAFRDALAARGKDYELIRRNDAPGLLLDLSLASKPRLLRQVVEDWGVVFSLWKTADAYLEADGQRRKHLRTLLRQLFFWAGYSRSRNVWPAHLTARQILLKREDTVASAERRALRAEALAGRLAVALGKITRELRIYSIVANSSLRPSIKTILKECEACLEEADYLERTPSRVRSRFLKKKPGLDEAHKADGVTIKLAATMERALGLLRDALSRFKPVDAFRARYVIRESEDLLSEILPKPQRDPLYIPLGIMVFDSTLYVSRLIVGFWLIPLVLAIDGQKRAQARKQDDALSEIELAGASYK